MPIPPMFIRRIVLKAPIGLPYMPPINAILMYIVPATFAMPRPVFTPMPPSLALVVVDRRGLLPGATSCTFSFASVMSLPAELSPAVTFIILLRPPGFEAFSSVTSAISR